MNQTEGRGGQDKTEKLREMEHTYVPVGWVGKIASFLLLKRSVVAGLLGGLAFVLFFDRERDESLSSRTPIYRDGWSRS